MKLAAIAALLVIGAACISSQYVTIWGDVVNTRIMAEQRVTVSSSWMQIKERTINYSSVSADSNKDCLDPDKQAVNIHYISIIHRTDHCLCEASCIWTIRQNTLSAYHSLMAVSDRILRRLRLYRRGVMVSIPLFDSTAKNGFECSLAFYWAKQINWNYYIQH